MSCKYCRRGAMKRPKPKPTPFRPLSSDQIAALMANLDSEDVNLELKHAVTLVLNTGMRLGELRDLQWTDVDDQNRTITIRSAVPSFYIHRIPYNAAVAEVLDIRRGSLHLSKYVFVGAPDRSLLREPRQLKELGKRVLGRALTFHDLRHTHFFMLAHNGVDLATLMSLGGWRSPLMPLKFMSPQPAAHVVAAFEAAMKKAQR